MMLFSLLLKQTISVSHEKISSTTKSTQVDDNKAESPKKAVINCQEFSAPFILDYMPCKCLRIIDLRYRNLRECLKCSGMLQNLKRLLT